jgi:hypothetical protein
VTYPDSVLVRYYAAVDAGNLTEALSLVDPAAPFAMTLPGRTNHGVGREGLAAYLTDRGDVDRRHVPKRVSIGDDVEFVHGSVVENGTTTTGHFLGAVSITAEGLIGSYQVVFDPDFSLTPKETA